MELEHHPRQSRPAVIPGREIKLYTPATDIVIPDGRIIDYINRIHDFVGDYLAGHGLQEDTYFNGVHDATITIRPHDQHLFSFIQEAIQRGKGPQDWHLATPMGRGSTSHRWVHQMGNLYAHHRIVRNADEHLRVIEGIFTTARYPGTVQATLNVPDLDLMMRYLQDIKITTHNRSYITTEDYIAFHRDVKTPGW